MKNKDKRRNHSKEEVLGERVLNSASVSLGASWLESGPQIPRREINPMVRELLKKLDQKVCFLVFLEFS